MTEPAAPSQDLSQGEMVWLSGGTFAMGSNDHYREETPVHRVNVDGFWIDRTEVTNGQYARFTDETGYRTVAERPLDPRLYPGAPPENLAPGSLVFQMTEGPVDLSRIDLWWRWTPGACWCRPKGPGSSIDGCEDHPVVHIAHEDAVAYASWAGKSLPSEAEWEFAARGGLEQQDFVWGQDEKPGEEIMANTWQGSFPWQNLATHGFDGTSPVGSFPANGYGLMDMAGNVWEWTADWWTARHTPPSLTSRAACRIIRAEARSKRVSIRLPWPRQFHERSSRVGRFSAPLTTVFGTARPRVARRRSTPGRPTSDFAAFCARKTAARVSQGEMGALLGTLPRYLQSPCSERGAEARLTPCRCSPD